jgi:hypothetical protein
MIFLKKQNILFIKPHKTASTSVEIALCCASNDPADIITPLLPEDELKRAEVGGGAPKNWAWLKSTELRYTRDLSEYIQSGIVPDRILPGGQGKLYSKFSARYYNHIMPSAIQWRGSGAVLRDSFLVSMVRHPYEQLVSWAWHQKKLLNIDSPFSAVVDRGLARPSPNLPYLFSKRRPDFVIRYERLAEDLAKLSDRVGIDLATHMTNAKGSYRSDCNSASDMLSSEQKKAIYARDRQIFEHYGYKL